MLSGCGLRFAMGFQQCLEEAAKAGLDLLSLRFEHGQADRAGIRAGFGRVSGAQSCVFLPQRSQLRLGIGDARFETAEQFVEGGQRVPPDRRSSPNSVESGAPGLPARAFFRPSAAADLRADAGGEPAGDPVHGPVQFLRRQGPLALDEAEAERVGNLPGGDLAALEAVHQERRGGACFRRRERGEGFPDRALDVGEGDPPLDEEGQVPLDGVQPRKRPEPPPVGSRRDCSISFCEEQGTIALEGLLDLRPGAAAPPGGEPVEQDEERLARVEGPVLPAPGFSRA